MSKGGRSIRQDAADALGIGIEQLDFTDINDLFLRGKITKEDFFKELEARNGGKDSEEHLLEHNDFYDREESVYELAQRIRSEGIPTGIFSNVYQPAADKLRELGNYHDFDPVILSCEVGNAKPDIQIYTLVLELLGLNPGEILFIDDKDRYLEPAISMGFKYVKSVSPDQVIRDVEKALLEENRITL